MNLYIIIGFLIALIGAGTGGAYFGYEYRDGKVAKEVQEALAGSIKEHNENTLIDMNAAYERGLEESKIRYITRTIQGEAIAAAPIVHCPPLDVAHRKLLDRAIDVYNDVKEGGK